MHRVIVNSSSKNRNLTRNQCTLIKSVVGALNQPKIRKPLGLRIYTNYRFCALNSLEVQNLIQRSLFNKVLVHLNNFSMSIQGKTSCIVNYVFTLTQWIKNLHYDRSMRMKSLCYNNVTLNSQFSSTKQRKLLFVICIN